MQPIKQIKKKEFDGKFKDKEIAGKTLMASGIIAGISGVSFLALCFFCPPAALVTGLLSSLSTTVEMGSLLAYKAKESEEYLLNKEFNEQKIINEIILEDNE